MLKKHQVIYTPSINHKTTINIGICHTKQTNHVDLLYNGLASGIKKHGYNVTHYKTIDEFNKGKSDVYIMVAYPYVDNFSDEWSQFRCKKQKSLRVKTKDFRNKVYNKAKNDSNPLIVIDSGLFKCKRNVGVIEQNYYHICLNGIKNLSHKYSLNSDKYRFDQLGLEIYPYKNSETNQNVLVLGQLRFGLATQHIDINLWYDWVANELFKRGKRVFFSPHPNELDARMTCGKYDIKHLSPKEPMSKRLKDIDSVITFSTNGCVEAILSGVPTIAMSEISVAYNICSNSLDELDAIKRPDREQWLYDLAYENWSVSEMKNGDWWNYMKDRI